MPPACLPSCRSVRYEDGLFCLFTASYSEPLRRWDASALTPQLPSSKQLTWALSQVGAAHDHALTHEAEPDAALAPFLVMMQEVTWLSWSPHRPSVFWVLLGRRGLLLAFDLLINDQAPIIIESLSKVPRQRHTTTTTFCSPCHGDWPVQSLRGRGASQTLWLNHGRCLFRVCV